MSDLRTTPGATFDNPIDPVGPERVVADLAAYLESRGEKPDAPAPVLLITTKGRSTGLWHRTVIFHARDEENIVLFGSNNAGAEHPNWYLNLEVNPTVYVQIKDRVVKTEAHIAAGGERELAWQTLIGVFPPYVQHQEKVERQIGIVVLEPDAA